MDIIFLITVVKDLEALAQPAKMLVYALIKEYRIFLSYLNV